MPSIATRFSFNLANGLAKIEYFLGAEVISTWEYDNGMIHVGVKEDTYHVSYDEVLLLNLDTRKWDDFISNNFNPAIFPQSEYEVELEKKEDGVSVKVKINDLEIGGISWEKGTGLVTYAPRPELDISWGDYYLWRKFGEEFLIAIKNFSQGK